MLNRSHSCIFVALFLFAPNVLRAAPTLSNSTLLPSASRILADYKTATGGAAWDALKSFVTTATVSTGGLTGKDTTTVDVLTGRYHDEYTVGPSTGADGFDGTKAWNQDSDGIARYVQSEDDRKSAIANAYQNTFAYWYPDRIPGTLSAVSTKQNGTFTDYVITAQPQGGYAFDMWFDPSTHFLVKTVEVGATQTNTTIYGDYRPIGGLMMPYSIRSSTGDPKYDSVNEVTSVTLNTPVTDADFALPVPTTVDYTIDGGAKSVTVPFRFLWNHIIVKVKIDGKGPFDAILDTGGRFVVTPKFAKLHGIEATGALPGNGTGNNTVNVGVAKLRTLQLGGITLKSPTLLVIPIPSIDRYVVIGYEFFNRFAVHVDYDHSVLTFTPLKEFKYVGPATAVPFVFRQSDPEIHGSIDGIQGGFTIDSGSGSSLDLFGGFVKANGI